MLIAALPFIAYATCKMECFSFDIVGSFSNKSLNFLFCKQYKHSETYVEHLYNISVYKS